MTDEDPVSVRVRGIYATALTERLRGRDGLSVVRASAPIRDRFEASFPVAPEDVAVETTGDRQGVGVHGPPADAEAVADALAVARDALDWRAAAPRGALSLSVVSETLGGGAVVALDGDGAEGYLPYDRADDYLETGDVVRACVDEPAPPWDDDRPLLATTPAVSGGLVELSRGGEPDGGEAARLAELLPVEVPDGWVPRWTPAADGAGMDALEASLERAAARAREATAALAAADPDDAPALVYAPAATVWVWFGRESRFALDGRRRRVCPTMAGHHRTKAADRRASAAVDFAEAVCDPGDGEFPFAAVARQFGPREGDRVAIGHGKPDGRLVTLGRGEVVDVDPGGTVTLRREMTAGGTYDALGVERRAGDVAVTKFAEGRWWYATVYRGADGERRGTYANVCTPLELFPDAVRYVDLHVDVVRRPDGTVERVDDDELDAAVAAGDVPEPLAEKAREVASRLEEVL